MTDTTISDFRSISDRNRIASDLSALAGQIARQKRVIEAMPEDGPHEIALDWLWRLRAEVARTRASTISDLQTKAAVVADEVENADTFDSDEVGSPISLVESTLRDVLAFPTSDPQKVEPTGHAAVDGDRLTAVAQRLGDLNRTVGTACDSAMEAQDWREIEALRQHIASTRAKTAADMRSKARAALDELRRQLDLDRDNEIAMPQPGSALDLLESLAADVLMFNAVPAAAGQSLEGAGGFPRGRWSDSWEASTQRGFPCRRSPFSITFRP